MVPLFHYELNELELKEFTRISTKLEELYNLEKKIEESKPKLEHPFLSDIRPSLGDIEDYVFRLNKYNLEQVKYRDLLKKARVEYGLTFNDHINNFIKYIKLEDHIPNNLIESTKTFIYEKYRGTRYDKIFSELLDILFFVRDISYAVNKES